METYESYEQWRDVLGYEGRYQVSSRGRVRSLARVVKMKNGYCRTQNARVLRIKAKTHPYHIAPLWKDGKFKDISVHRLVAMAFIPNPKNKPEVNHKNRCRKDNRVENLEWTTKREHVAATAKAGLYRHGSKCWNAKLTNRKVRRILEYLKGGVSCYVLMKWYEVNMSVICGIKNNTGWKHIPREEI